MKCKTLLYTNKDIDVLLQIEETAFESTDVQDLIVKLELKSESGGTILKTYSMSGGSIVRSDNDLIMSIPRTDITTQGEYKIKITMIDNDGKHRGITPCSSVTPHDCLEFVNA